MSRRMLVALLCVLTLPAAAWAQTGALQAALAALGATALRSVEYTATGNAYVLGQPPSATEPWPIRPVKSYQISIDYGTQSARIEQVLTMPTPQPRGGGAPFVGEQRQIQLVRGAFAWNLPPTGQGDPVPQQAAAWERLLWMWMSTPHGLLKAAGNTSAKPVADGAELAFTVGGRYSLWVHINKQNHVDRARAYLDNPVLGDMLVETTYSGYKDFGGIVFPSRITQSMGGYPTLELNITSVTANPFVDITVPENVRLAGSSLPPATAKSEKVADGIYWIIGGSHHSLAVDMGDHIVVIEAPQHEMRSEAVIAEVKKVIPNKPIRYVVNTHVHFDHSGGLRTYVDEGATVVTHQANVPFYQKAWANPRTIGIDRLAKSKKTPNFMGVGARAELKGTNNRVIELHTLAGNPHNEQTLVAWLPAERILFQSDMMNPPAPGAQVPPPTPTITNFYENLQRLKIQPEQIVGGHGARIATAKDLMIVAGKGGTN